MKDAHRNWIDAMTASIADSVPVDHIVDSVHAAMENIPFVGPGFAGLQTGSEVGHADERVGVGPSAELEVTNVIAGEISVRAGENGVIHIRATGPSSQFKSSQQGDRVVVAPSWPAPAQFQIEVPGGCRVAVKTVDADVTVAGTHAPVAVETVGGDVSIEGAAGECRLVTVSGDATADRLSGALTWRSMSGDLRVSRSALRAFTLQSIGGDFNLDTSLAPEGEYVARTTSGTLLLSVPPGTGATVSLTTTSGTVISELPAEVEVQERRRWQGRVNGGGARLEMMSVSGDLRIVDGSPSGSRPAPSFDPTPPAGPIAPPPPPAPQEEPGPQPVSEETAEILRALERGEMDVEEAMSRLDRLEGQR